VVLGHEAERVRAEIADLPCWPIVNADHARGQGTSLQVGVAEVSSVPKAGAAVVMLADMPFVTAAMLSELAGRYLTAHAEGRAAPMILSRYGDVDAPPMLYDRALFAEILALPAEAGGKEMVRRHKQEAATMLWPEEALADIDRPDDYQRIRAAMEPR